MFDYDIKEIYGTGVDYEDHETDTRLCSLNGQAWNKQG